MSWQTNPPDFWKWVPLNPRDYGKEVPWWAVWHKEPVMVRVFHRGWTDYGVFIDEPGCERRILARASDFKLWWHEPILPPATPPEPKP